MIIVNRNYEGLVKIGIKGYPFIKMKLYQTNLRLPRYIEYSNIYFSIYNIPKPNNTDNTYK